MLVQSTRFCALHKHAFKIFDFNSEALDCNPLLRRSISYHDCFPSENHAWKKKEAHDQGLCPCMLLKSLILTAKRLIVTLRVTMVFYHAKCVKGYGTEMSTLPLTQLGLLMRYEPFLDGWGRLITIFCKTDKGLNREEKAFVERRNFITEKYLRVIHPGAQEEYRNWRIGSKDILLSNAGDWRKALPPR